MRNILLATYNYYPFNWGGSEVYVHGLANSLRENGDKVRIIAAVPEFAINDAELFFSDKNLKIGIYEHDGVEVIGCFINPSKDEIYSKYNPVWEQSWATFLSDYWNNEQLDILHIHGNTSLIGAALIGAVKKVFPKIKTLFTYHVADTCPKGTLYYYNEITCGATPSVDECTACVIHEKWGVSPALAKMFSNIWIDQFFPKKTPASFTPKKMTKLSLQGFDRLANCIDRWHVFSPQIENHLMKLGIEKKEITVIRHGANNYYFQEHTCVERFSDRLVFLFIGRFKKIKGLATLLKAWLNMSWTDKRELWLVGNGDDMEPNLSNLVNEAKKRLEIKFFGVVEVEELKPILQKAHCLIIPSEVVETGPLVFHEAIACGTNVIASNIGGCKSLAEYYNDGCTQFNTGSAKDLGQKMLNFVYSPISKKVMSQGDHYMQIMNEYERLGAIKAIATA